MPSVTWTKLVRSQDSAARMARLQCCSKVALKPVARSLGVASRRLRMFMRSATGGCNNGLQIEYWCSREVILPRFFALRKCRPRHFGLLGDRGPGLNLATCAMPLACIGVPDRQQLAANRGRRCRCNFSEFGASRTLRILSVRERSSLRAAIIESRAERMRWTWPCYADCLGSRVVLECK